MTADSDPQLRHGLRGWFGKLRRRRWVALFAFEFVVVVLGVLVAQGLSSYFADAAEQRRADDAMDALRVELGLLDVEVEKRRRDYWCTVFRLGLMQQRLNGGEVAIPHRMFHPPEGSLVTFAGWDSGVIGSMRRYLEPEEIQAVIRVGELANQLEQLQRTEREAWNDMHRLSDDLGEPSETDRSTAKGGLVAGKLAIGSIIGVAQRLRADIEALGVSSDFSELEQYRDHPETCQQVIGYDLETQTEVMQRTGRLVTGQKVQ
jgi:hypothetical protein